MAADTSWLAPAIVAAALVIRAAVGELRQPGSAREQWSFATDHQAMVTGAAVGVAILLLGWHQTGPAAAAWALLIAALTAHVVHKGTHRL